MCIRLVSCIYVSLIVVTNEIKIGRIPSTNYFWKLIIQLADENYENGLNFNTPDTCSFSYSYTFIFIESPGNIQESMIAKGKTNRYAEMGELVRKNRERKFKDFLFT